MRKSFLLNSLGRFLVIVPCFSQQENFFCGQQVSKNLLIVKGGDRQIEHNVQYSTVIRGQWLTQTTIHRHTLVYHKWMACQPIYTICI